MKVPGRYYAEGRKHFDWGVVHSYWAFKTSNFFGVLLLKGYHKKKTFCCLIEQPAIVTAVVLVAVRVQKSVLLMAVDKNEFVSLIQGTA